MVAVTGKIGGDDKPVRLSLSLALALRHVNAAWHLGPTG